MWVFGYGSLMWDGWEAQYGCARTAVANLPGYCRAFNKASVRNWGTKSHPCPTLNLTANAAGVCRGIAFEFDSRKEEVLAYLEQREGKGFELRELLVRLDDSSEISAVVPIYEGKNLIQPVEAANLAANAQGTNGLCLEYVKGIAEKLADLDIEDPVVSEFWHAVRCQERSSPNPGDAADT